jgi:sulfhydrogenase subunit beta (sulfur reductase)
MRFIRDDHLRAWLDRLAGEYDLVAPRDVDGHLLYRPVESSQNIVFDYERPELSAKDFLFPPSETLLRITRQADGVTMEEVLPQRQQVIFGLRPCDARGLLAIDALFIAREPVDTIYAYHRQRTTLVGLACPRMWEGCFCTSIGGAPDGTEGLDLLLTRHDDGYAVQVLSDKGAALAAQMALEERAGEPPPSERNAASVPLPPPADWPAWFNDPMWSRHGERCISCRACTYVCPTCRCFDVTDEVIHADTRGTLIERVRTWDACTSPNYRRIAGGHNPRAKKPDRIRNRFFCKFHYYPTDFGPTGCVGCGRCILVCPVNIDITEVLRDVAAHVEGRSSQ